LTYKLCMLYKNFAIYSTHIFFLLAISSRDNVLVTVVIPKQALLQHKREICWYTEHSYFTPCRTKRSNLKFVTRVLTKKNEKKQVGSLVLWYIIR